ncbi:MAG: 50S ribosomal protein L4 [Actinomycetota bacterium]
MNVKIVNTTGESSSEFTLDDSIFAAKVSVPLMHQAVVAQLAAARAGTHSTKTRAEVRGGGAKPWRQKGTGRARHGSSREPQWKGGGVAWGPKPRDHSVSLPKKMKAAALRSALSARAKDEALIVAEGLSSEKPKTKDAVAALKAWGVDGKALIVLARDDSVAAFSFRNLPKVHLISEDQLNVYDVLNADKIIFTTGAIEAFQSRLGGVGGTSGAERSRRPEDDRPPHEGSEA